MEVKPHTITLKTLTPLWSGGASRKCDNGLLETSILGSLRWWLEALVRGYGIEVPELGDGEDSEHTENHPVADAFGHTGQKRRFRLQIDQRSVKAVKVTPGSGDSITIPSNGPRDKASWYFPGGAALCGVNGEGGQPSIRISVVPYRLKKGNWPSFGLAELEGLFAFISRWGALGAKTQQGFGVISYASKPGAAALAAWLDACAGEHPRQPTRSGLPSVDRLFHLTIRLAQPLTAADDQQRLKKALTIRQDLRGYLHTEGKTDPLRDFRHRILGSVRRNERLGSRLSFSMPYAQSGGQVVRIWGWDDEPERVLKSLRTWLDGRTFSVLAPPADGPARFEKRELARWLVQEAGK